MPNQSGYGRITTGRIVPNARTRNILFLRRLGHGAMQAAHGPLANYRPTIAAVDAKIRAPIQSINGVIKR